MKLTIFFLVIIFAVVSCDNSIDPSIAVQKKITKTWRIDSVNINGKYPWDWTIGNDYALNKNQTFKFNNYPRGIRKEGTWSVSSDGKIIILNYKNSLEEFQIVELTDKLLVWNYFPDTDIIVTEYLSPVKVYY